MASDRPLRWFLRITAVVLLSSAAVVLFPYSWMNAIHEWLGLGTLADQPITSYMTRSLSGLYASLGACCWHIAGDVQRYRSLLRFALPVAVTFGAALVA